MDVQTAFPVGRVEYLYPMTFEEFLLALGEETLYDLLTTEVPIYAHQLLEWFHVYAMLGGMPEVVAFFYRSCRAM
ncbi:MAG: hypothetical protein Q8L68_04590 [Methylococcales bacterium]|nr:hypothetical protein [Methylococcales bacterium]